MTLIRIIQPVSPQCILGNRKYIPGAVPGQILLGDDVLLKTIHFEPAKFSRTYMEWGAMRGGLVKDHKADPAVLHQCLPQTAEQRRQGKFAHCNGHEVAEYSTYESATGAVLSLTATMSDALGPLVEGRKYMLTTELRNKRFGSIDVKYYAFKVSE